MGSPSGQVASGSVMSTGAAIEVECGFRPRYIRWMATDAIGEWVDGMADASAVMTVGAAARISSAGITPGNLGFTVGTNADLNNATPERCDWIAWA